MKVEISRNVPLPIAVNDRLLDAIQACLAEVSDTNIKSIAAENKIDPELVSSIGHGDEPNDLEIQNLYEIRYLMNDSDPAYSLAYENGFSFRTSDLEQLKGTLHSESEAVKTLEISAGLYRKLHLKITIGGWLRGVTYSVSGDRRDVEYISTLLSKAFENAQPVARWIRSPWPGRLLYPLTMIFVGLLGILIISSFDDSLVQSNIGLFAFFWMISVSAALFMADYPVKRLREIFPSIEFEYGLSKRRRIAKRRLLTWIASVVIIPIILALVPLLYSASS
jgi:hypothetical protein